MKKVYNTKRWKNIKSNWIRKQRNWESRKYVDENIGEVQLRNFIKEKPIQKDVIETTIEVAV